MKVTFTDSIERNEVLRALREIWAQNFATDLWNEALRKAIICVENTPISD
jgi:hypothetical protein